MLHSHVAEAEGFLPVPFTVVASQLPIHAELPADSEPLRQTLSQKAHALCHADQYVHRGDVFDVHMRATVKSGGVFLKLCNGRGWVAEQTPLGEKVAAEAKLTPCTDVFRVLTESLRCAPRERASPLRVRARAHRAPRYLSPAARSIRKSASRTDVALSTRVTRVDQASGLRELDLAYSDVFEAAGSVAVRGDTYLRLKDGRGYVLSTDGSIPVVARVQPQVRRAAAGLPPRAFPACSRGRALGLPPAGRRVDVQGDLPGRHWPSPRGEPLRPAPRRAQVGARPPGQHRAGDRCGVQHARPQADRQQAGRICAAERR